MQNKHKLLKIPFLDQPSRKEYTLVLDLDETLIHYNQMDQSKDFMVRPFAE